MKMSLLDKKSCLLLLGVAITLTSCDNYLDELPDNRMTLKSTEEISKLLVSAYPDNYPAYLTEMYSDNTDENIGTGWSSYDRFQEEAYNWEDITSTGDSDDPQDLWGSYYSAVAVSNQAIEYINSLPDQSEASAQLGEALICRAYSMYKLSTIFCRAYDPATASTDLGLPYSVASEKTIGAEYERGTLQELYEKIDADIQKGLPLISNTYAAPKYHFTQNAAYAFACRFYLNYRKFDKAIEYATKVLGSNPATKLRDWATWKSLSANAQVQPDAYVSSDNSANLLLFAVKSSWGVVSANYRVGLQYNHNNFISQTESLESAGPWGSSGSVLGYKLFKNNVFPGPFIRSIPYHFEYTDVQAGIGYAHSVFAEFTTDKLLMERAEAYALSGNYSAAVADINSELSAFRTSSSVTLTLDGIKDFYNGIDYYTPEKPTVKKKFNTTLVTDAETQEPLLQCILHLDRLMMMHEGMRLQYIKRYGITIYRRQVDKSNSLIQVTDTMEPSDPRLAIQLPQDVITAGMEANPRNK